MQPKWQTRSRWGNFSVWEEVVLVRAGSKFQMLARGPHTFFYAIWVRQSLPCFQNQPATGDPFVVFPGPSLWWGRVLHGLFRFRLTFCFVFHVWKYIFYKSGYLKCWKAAPYVPTFLKICVGSTLKNKNKTRDEEQTWNEKLEIINLKYFYF